MSIKAQSGYPGTISLANPAQAYPGAKAKWFWSVGAYNRFFQEKPGKPPHGMVVITAQPTPYFLGLLIGVMVQYTKQLSPEEEADMLRVTREIEFKMAEIRQEREAKAEEERRVKEATEAEMKRLAQVGAKYEERVKHARAQPTLAEQSAIMDLLNKGDPEVLFQSKAEAFAAGYVKGHQVGGAK